MLLTTPLRRWLLASALLLLAVGAQQVQAQTATPQTGGPTPQTPDPTPQTPDPTPVPLDGGASLLLAGGVAYGLRKLRQRRRQ